ncbi:alkylation response protein AidB-like acyl-CoA dehydrogenase [Anoxybacillus vitaminiphilus]|uniref:Alkylation response protein AidB-like acyl-CoA dehydrogenase n=1 Tax=Paranoxybacillus vitaminiphilus TaxID=581036 RepID=A0A327Y1Q9_9BACL|nr:acyl-CoA dehydrogenase family protein [Anoxybacillus vitaminiphilus]RAK15050.1 alkylation response protein AidB-like acyl-CoA dehydrogenase [Anoxybacillus vitaminiphilus]
MLNVKEYKGGSFINENISVDEVFTPEEFTDEHYMMADMAEKFMMKEVMPALEKIEAQQFDQTVRLLKKAGELGLLGVDVPEQYGGLDLDKVSSCIISEKVALGRSFGITFGGQVGIGSLPIVFFGTNEQKEAYLPYIVTGEKIGAYALTEPTSGTDALAAKTSARLSDCGKYYILNGEKQWITNSAFADFFIVFAKVDGQQFTAFIVERDYEGVSIGPEEKKMGLKGSSTCSLILDNVKVPVNNVLGDIGKGHVIAFNILNIGRHKISATALGMSKRAIELSVKYAKERKQFGRSLSEFRLIQNKIADMAIKTYVNESMIYRTAGAIEKGLEEGKGDIAKTIAEYAVECSVNKVFSTEALDFIVDEAVQIHGGYGYMSEYEVEALYRDARIYRIFEGTNEINRMLIASTLLRKYKDQLSEMIESRKIEEDLLLHESIPLGDEKQHLYRAKSLFLLIANIVQKQYIEKEKEQELLACLADMAIEIYAIESALLRTEKAMAQNGVDKEEQKKNYVQVYVQETIQQLLGRSLNVLPYLKDDEQLLKIVYQNIEKSNQSLVDIITIKRKIAEKIIRNEKYVV